MPKRRFRVHYEYQGQNLEQVVRAENREQAIKLFHVWMDRKTKHKFWQKRSYRFLFARPYFF